MRLKDLNEGIKFTPSVGAKIAKDPKARMGIEFEFYLDHNYEHDFPADLHKSIEYYSEGGEIEFGSNGHPCFKHGDAFITHIDGEWFYVDNDGSDMPIIETVIDVLSPLFQPEVKFFITSLLVGDIDTAKEYLSEVTIDPDDLEQFFKFIIKPELIIFCDVIREFRQDTLDSFLNSNNYDKYYFNTFNEQLDEWIEPTHNFDTEYLNSYFTKPIIQRKPDKDEVLEIVERELDKTDVDFDIIEYDSPHSSIIEVITGVLSIENGINNIKSMLDFIQGDVLPLYTDDSCGMHVSISYKGASDTFDLNKFIVLLSTERIQGLFPKRNFITNLDDQVMEIFNVIYNEVLDADNNKSSYNTLLYNLQNPLPIIKRHFNKVVNNHITLVPTNNKNQAINFEDFHIHDGRIELRYVGGDEDTPYETRFKLLEFEVLRAIYMLQISNTNMYETKYKKKLYSYYEGIIDTLQNIYYHLENKEYDEIKGEYIRYKLGWVLQ